MIDSCTVNTKAAFMVSLSNHEGVARATVGIASWFDKLTMKRKINKTRPWRTTS